MIVVTGGTGLLGSHLLLELARKHERITALKRPSSDLEEVRKVFFYHSPEADKLFRRIRWTDTDLMSQQEVEEVVRGAGQVYHCAAMVSFQPRDRQKMIDFNVQSTTHVVQGCLKGKVNRLMHVSSSSAIGRPPEDIPAGESMIWTRSKTNTGYSVSKFQSEMEVWRGMEEGLKAVIVNPAIILGPGFWEKGSSSMFTRIDRGLKYATTGVTGYVGVQDVVSVMTGLMEHEWSGERFIVSAGDYSYTEIFSMIAEAIGKPREFRQASPAMLMSLSRLDSLASLFTGRRSITSDQAMAAFDQVHFSAEKVQKALGIRFTPIPEVIRNVARHYLSNHRQ